MVTKTCRTVSATILVGLAAASCDSQAPRSPAEPSPPVPVIVRLDLVVPASIAPGGSAQLTVNAVRSDNTVEDVSGRAQWFSSDRHVLDVSPAGLATALARGQAFIDVSYQSHRASALAFVLPPGTYRLDGTITDSDVPLPGVSVRVIDGVEEVLTATTDARGRYALYGVRGPVRLLARASGYLEEIQAIDVTAHQSFDFRMRVAGQRTDVSGTYRLTIDRNPARPSGCTSTALPDSRSYEAVVEQAGLRLTVTLSGADFIVTRGRGNGFSGTIDGTGRVTFVLGDQEPYYWEDRAQDLVERIGASQPALVITGTVTAEPSAAGLSGTLRGWFLFADVGQLQFRILPDSCYSYTTHRFEMVRRR